MARTALDPLLALGTLGDYSGLDVVDLAMVPADTVNKNQVVANGRDLVIVHNTNGGAQTVTIESAGNVKYKRTEDISAYSVGAGEYAIFGPFRLPGWRQAGGVLHLEGSHADLLLGVIDVPANKKRWVAAPPDPVLWIDSFTDTNGVLLPAHSPDRGGVYTNQQGVLDVQSNRGNAATLASLLARFTCDPGTADGTITFAAVNIANVFGQAWIYFRWLDASNYIQFNMNTLQDRSYLTKVVAGTPTVVDTSGIYTLNDGVDYEVVIRLDGTSIEVDVDGTTRNTATIADHLTETVIGAGFNGVGSRVDDFMVSSAV